jgi:hypothetical protein
MSARKTIRDVPQSKVNTSVTAPRIVKPKRDDPRERLLKQCAISYPSVPSSYVAGLLDVEWLSTSNTSFLSQFQEVLDALEQAGPQQRHYDILLATARSSNIPDQFVDVASQSTKELYKLLEVVRATDDTQAIQDALEVVIQSRNNERAMYRTIRDAEDFSDIRDQLTQFEASDVAHNLYVKSLLVRPKGIVGTVPCAKCGCFEYYRDVRQSSSLDEPSRVIHICVSCTPV